MIKAVNVTTLTDNIKRLYAESFPAGEQIPAEIFQQLIDKKTLKPIEYYDDNTFVGFIIYATIEKFCYLSYFAVNTQIRSKGYGSQIIQKFRQDLGQYNIVFGIEEVTNVNDLQDQKTRRYLFYKKNGFIMNDFRAKMTNGLIFNLMSNKPVIRSEFEKLMKTISPNIGEIIPGK